MPCRSRWRPAERDRHVRAQPRWLSLLLAWLLLCPSPTWSQSVEYRLGPHDRIQVTVFNEANLSGDFEVNGEGKVTLPLIGEVAVGGTTVREAEQAVADKLYPDYLLNPRVSIQVTNYRPFYILGEVKKPGSYQYVTGLTVVQAVALAGGFTYRARQGEVTLLRGIGCRSHRRRCSSPETLSKSTSDSFKPRIEPGPGWSDRAVPSGWAIRKGSAGER